PGGEAAAQREAGQPLEDAQEDLLRQVLRQRAVADEAEDVVEDGLLVRPHDQRERPLVALLSLAEDAGIGLHESQCAPSVARSGAETTKDLPIAGLPRRGAAGSPSVGGHEDVRAVLVLEAVGHARPDQAAVDDGVPGRAVADVDAPIAPPRVAPAEGAPDSTPARRRASGPSSRPAAGAPAARAPSGRDRPARRRRGAPRRLR